MRLPPFLRFLEPRIKPAQEGLGFVGHVRVERQAAGGEVELVHDSKNFIVNVGIEAIRDLLIGPNGAGFTGSIFRMAVGDAGTPPAELFNPKLPDATWPARTALYHEVLRQDISVFTTPTPASMRFVGSFNSVGVLDGSYGSAAKVINEAALIIGDGILTGGGDPKQAGVGIDADEVMLSTRTFKSASFDNAEDVTVTITWTITVATT